MQNRTLDLIFFFILQTSFIIIYDINLRFFKIGSKKHAVFYEENRNLLFEFWKNCTKSNSRPNFLSILQTSFIILYDFLKLDQKYTPYFRNLLFEFRKIVQNRILGKLFSSYCKKVIQLFTIFHDFSNPIPTVTYALSFCFSTARQLLAQTRSFRPPLSNRECNNL